MRTNLNVLTTLLFVVAVFDFGNVFAAGNATANGKYVTQAQAMITSMAKDDFNKAETDFTDVMKQAAPPAKLQEVWSAITAQQGDFEKISGTKTLAKDGYLNVLVETQFKNGALLFNVTFDAGGKIAGFHIVSAG
ncbi:MAG: DUF3887 domain-containing protein [Gammaproteobacteria bacterium]|nr:DUF3887 domain-containing protein [Gammaproteobacteria bacterium]MBU6510019.1 DUF3887 domain-containing protein [Gammaproteobacteria bacterium]MDE1983955.1 DUF3887 domain-containing protein [Gammaproteobacteria bacterium]MDE2108131.1 DUF3887 domain-containing protein [Gammaproteobacteria bacterium]MDE2461211.1 DUF3887 domain-containing protein [Gammaproteobacteria bacterium]